MANNPFDQQQETIRIPLAGHLLQRHGTVGLFDSRQLQDQMFINCYPMISRDPVKGDAPQIRMQSRLGWGLSETSVDLSNDDQAGTVAVVSNFSTSFVKAVCTMTGLEDVIIVCYADQAASCFRFAQYRLLAGTCRYLGAVSWGGNFDKNSYVHLTEVTIGIANVPYVAINICNQAMTYSWSGYVLSTGGQMQPYNAVGPDGVRQITDVNFPSNIATPKVCVGPFIQLKENIYIMTRDGFIYNCELDADGCADIVNWNSLGYVTAQSYADKGIGLCRYKHHIVAFGQETVEFFNHNGIAAPASPLAPTEQAFIRIGAIHQKAFINTDDTLWWVSTSQSGHIALYKLDGYTPQKMSEPYFSRQLSDRVYNLDLQVTTMHGMRHLVLNTGVYGHTWFDDGVNNGDTVTGANSNLIGNLCFCIDTSSWWVWSMEHGYASGGTGINPRYFFCVLYTYYNTIRLCFTDVVDAGGANYALHPARSYPYQETTTGTAMWDAFRLKNDATIDSYRIPVMIVTNPYDFGNDKRKFLRSVKIIGDHIKDTTSVSPPVSAFNTEGLTLNLGFSREDGNIGTTAPEIKRSKALRTQTEHRYNFNNFGAFRKGRFWISINTYVPVRLEALELTIAQGTH